jgi:hypothetical protein
MTTHFRHGEQFDIPEGDYMISGELKHLTARRWTITGIYYCGTEQSMIELNGLADKPISIAEVEMIIDQK